jgi:ketosteroid isomerase-like protein
MREENVDALAVVRRFLELINEEHVEQALTLLASDAELDWSDSQAPDRGVYHGPDGWRGWLAGRAEGLADARFEVAELTEVAPGTVVLVAHMSGRGRASGLETRALGAGVCTVRDGLIARIRMYQSRDEALAALGLQRPGVEGQVSENVDLVRSIYADWERGDFSNVEWAHPDLEYVQIDGPHPGAWGGAMPKGFRDLLAAWDDFQLTPEAYRELDDERVLALSRISARGKSSGVELPEALTPHATLFHVRDGQVIRVVVYFDRERALADLGLGE